MTQEGLHVLVIDAVKACVSASCSFSKIAEAFVVVSRMSESRRVQH
jgi:hypothetical protein